MPLNHDAVGGVTEAEERSWGSADALLYALGVGAGTDELAFTTENSEGIEQRVLPTMVVTLGTVSKSIWPIIGPFEWAHLVHGEQAIELNGPLPVGGRISVTSRVAGLYDKGTAAVVVVETEATDASTGRPLFVNRGSMFIRGEGGWGGERGLSARREPPPEREPDHTVVYCSSPDQALLYRLTGDRNPLHSDPAFARKAGFDRPILHGLCTFGFTGRGLLHALCDGDPARFQGMSARFSAPAYPGDNFTVAIWVTGPGEAVFQTARTGGQTVIDCGRFTFG